jgi:hypothetical protein
MRLEPEIEHQALAYTSKTRSKVEMMIDLILSNLYVRIGGRRYQRRGEC